MKHIKCRLIYDNTNLYETFLFFFFVNCFLLFSISSIELTFFVVVLTNYIHDNIFIVVIRFKITLYKI